MLRYSQNNVLILDKKHRQKNYPIINLQKSEHEFQTPFSKCCKLFFYLRITINLDYNPTHINLKPIKSNPKDKKYIRLQIHKLNKNLNTSNKNYSLHHRNTPQDKRPHILYCLLFQKHSNSNQNNQTYNQNKICLHSNHNFNNPQHNINLRKLKSEKHFYKTNIDRYVFRNKICKCYDKLRNIQSCY